MEPIGFDEANINYGPPPGTSEEECQTIRARREVLDGRLLVTACWRPTKEELEEIIRTGQIWVTQWGGVRPHRLDGLKPDWWRT